MIQDTRYVRGVEKLSRRIATIRESFDLPDMMQETQGLLLRRTLDRFDKQVDPDGNPWTPLSRATKERRARGVKDRGKRILNEEGKMREAIKAIRGMAAAGAFTNTGAGFRIGITDPTQVGKAQAHQGGTAKIPQRRFLGIGRLDIKAVDGMFRRRAAKAGF